MLPEISLAAALQEEDEPTGAAVLKYICLVRAQAVERHHRPILIEEQLPEPVECPQRFAHRTMVLRTRKHLA